MPANKTVFAPEQIEHVPTSSLTPYARNSRTHSPQQVKQIAASIKEFGFINPIIVDATNTIIAGHGRLAAAEHLQLDTVPCVRVEHMTDTQRRAYVIADNKLALNAGWDEELLKLELDDLHLADFDLSIVGFAADELTTVMGYEDPQDVVEDELPEPPAEPITKPGDLWLLGDHRLLCGDSTNAEDVARLMDGTRADLCFTSPPYALGKSVSLSGNRTMAALGSPYDKHDDLADSWAQLMSGWWDASLPAVSYAWLVNVQPLAGNKRDLMRWIHDRVDRLIDIVTWDKGHAAPQMAAGVMANRYEWIIALGDAEASRAMPLSTWRGTVQSVYQGPPQRDNDYAHVHAATMPVHLPSWVIGTLCDKTQSVYDPFCGTGTTLIAAEQLGRKCYGMEISPAYCDVIVKRWENLTGQKAILESSNGTA